MPRKELILVLCYSYAGASYTNAFGAGMRIRIRTSHSVIANVVD